MSKLYLQKAFQLPSASTHFTTKAATFLLLFLFLTASLSAQTLKYVNGLIRSSPIGGEIRGQSIAVNAAGDTYITGYFQGTVDFDPGANTVNISSNAGSYDIFIAKYDASGNYKYAKSMGGTGTDYGYSIAVDAIGNVYITGIFEGIADFDPGAGTVNLTSAGSFDVFIAKYDASGNYKYAKSMGGTGTDNGNSIAVDASGIVYITGNFSGTSDFDPGAGVANLSSNGNNWDIFIAKYDASGNYMYAKGVGGTGSDYGNSIAVDASGNAYITGSFEGTVDFDPGAGTANLTGNGAFIAKYNALGNYVYAKSILSALSVKGSSIAVDAAGEVYITGSFYSTADFDPGAGTVNLTSNGNDDIFIAKYDASGNYVYAKSIGGTGSDFGSSIAIDAAGNAYITGSFQGMVDFDPGASVANLNSADGSNFIAKYDASGNYVFAKGIGGTGYAFGSFIAVDNTDNIYTSGSFVGTADFDPGAGTANLTSPSNVSSSFVAKLSSAGGYLWAIQQSTYNTGAPGSNSGRSVAVDAAGNTYVAGNFYGTIDFDPGTGTANLTGEGGPISGGDIFIAKYDASGNYIYAKKIGSAASIDHVVGLAIDADGNVYITGNFFGTADFDPSAGTVNLTSNSDDFFIAKYDASGNYVYAHMIGKATSKSNDIAVDAAGNVYVTGIFQGTVDFDPGASTANLTSAGDYDIFIAKYDASGNYVYAKGIGSTGADAGNSITVDAAGVVYITGTFRGTVDFDPGAGVANLTSAGANDIFIAKYNELGNYVYAKGMGGANADIGKDLAVDAAGNVYLTGNFSGTADFDPGPGVINFTSNGNSDIFFAKYNAFGDYVYAKSIGGTGFDYGISIAVDASGSVYLTGIFDSVVDFDPNMGTANITSNGGGGDIFIAKYNAAGNYVYAKGVGGTGSDAGNDIAIDASGNAYVIGYFVGTVDFDPGAGLPNSVVTGYNGSDIFVAKYGSAGALPVRLLNFTATPADNGASVLVNWQTADERNNHHFEVQRSTNGLAFQTIGQQPACTNCAAVQPYTFTDNAPYSGLSYYRLKQVDIDGSATYSKIVTVYIGNQHQSSVLLYPNITDAAFTVWIKGNTAERQVAINIVTASGSIVKKQTVWLHKGDNKIDMSLSGQVSGIYYVQVTDAANNSSTVLKVIKQ